MACLPQQKGRTLRAQPPSRGPQIHLYTIPLQSYFLTILLLLRNTLSNTPQQCPWLFCISGCHLTWLNTEDRRLSEPTYWSALLNSGHCSGLAKRNRSLIQELSLLYVNSCHEFWIKCVGVDSGSRHDLPPAALPAQPSQSSGNADLSRKRKIKAYEIEGKMCGLKEFKQFLVTFTISFLHTPGKE